MIEEFAAALPKEWHVTVLDTGDETKTGARIHACRELVGPVIPEIIVRALRQRRLAMTHGLQTREFNYVEDLVDGLVRAATTEGVDGELFNLGCGEETSVRSLATTILELLGNPIAAEFDALRERPSEIPRMFSDSSKARTLLGWNPRWTLADGLAPTIDWYRVELERSGSPFAL